MDFERKLAELEKVSRDLDPGPEQRKELLKCIVDSADQFLDGLENMDSQVFIQESDTETSQILQHPIKQEGTPLKELITLFEKTVLKTGVQAAHGMHLGLVPTGGLYPSALGDYLTAVTNKYVGLIYASPEGVRLEKMVLSWVAGLFGYPPEHAGSLTSGGTAAEIVALTTARDSMKLKAKEYERSVVYLTDMTHFAILKALRIAGMREAVVREIAMDDKLAMDVSMLKKQIENDIKAGLKPFLVVASFGTGITGSVDPIDQIADVAEEYNLWFHVDAAYGGFFVLVDDAKHIFKGIERSDSIVVDPHKGLFVPYGTGILLVRNGRKLYESNSMSSRTYIFQDAPEDQDEYSPCDLSFELTRHPRGLRVWLPLKLFGVRPFAAALEEKLTLAKYFHSKISAMDGFVAEPAPTLSIVVFYYDTKDDKKTNEFNRALQTRILQDGRAFMTSTTVRDRYHLRLCILSFRTHREHIDLCLQIIEENCNSLKKQYGLL
ncbi:aromatic-L-amino-acid decarboxylase-like [Glandiceps talaboti]